MRDRLFVFYLAVLLVFIHIIWWIDGGWGALYLGMIFVIFLFSWWGGSVAIRLGSPKAMGKGFSSSIGPNAHIETFPPHAGPKGEIWPSLELWTLGGGARFGLTPPGTGIFVVCRRGLSVLSDTPGATIPNVWFNGHPVVKTRADFIKYKFFRETRPHIADERAWLPKDVVDRMTTHSDWDWMRAKVIMIDVPVHPVITLDEAKHMQLHGARGTEPVPLAKFLPDINEHDPKTMVLDLVHVWDATAAKDNLALRTGAAAEANAERAKSSNYRKMLNEVTDVQDRVTFGPMERLREVVVPEDDTEGGAGR